MNTPGTRIYRPLGAIPAEVEDQMQPGDYWKFEPHDLWVVRLPNGDFGSINNKIWQITQHEDGAITVSPSILIHKSHTAKGWHGYLERGVWRDA